METSRSILYRKTADFLWDYSEQFYAKGEEELGDLLREFAGKLHERASALERRLQ